MDKCPHCGQEAFKHELTKYCMYCGKELEINTCKSYSCVINKEQIILPDFATYCPVCGKKTTKSKDIPF